MAIVLTKGKKVITDNRILKAMAKKEGFSFPIDKGHSYVDEGDNFALRWKGFSYKGKHYKIEYLSGCFFPFVIEQ